MTYEEIYSQFYLKKTDPKFFKDYTKQDAYEIMNGWLKITSAFPYIRKCFSTFALNDELAELTYVLKNSVDEESDDYFVKEIFAQGMAICWMQQKIDKATSLATVIGTKEERTILNNYKNNIVRLQQLKSDLKKFIRDYGYCNNDYIGER